MSVTVHLLGRTTDHRDHEAMARWYAARVEALHRYVENERAMAAIRTAWREAATRDVGPSEACDARGGR